MTKKYWKIDDFKTKIMKNLKVTINSSPTYWIRRNELHAVVDPKHHKDGGGVMDMAIRELVEDGKILVKRHRTENKTLAVYVTAA